MKNNWVIYSPTFEADQIVTTNTTGPWSGHRNFAYDLINFLEPDCVVELGTHWGNSFFSFCQAVKDNKLNTMCIAVDTWLGEEHAGEYGEDVFQAVKDVIARYYNEIDILLLKKTFLEALIEVDDASIDILHIDGLHTYEAVSTDFTNWLPKMKKDGIVLFHDICPELDYGSKLFWEEVSQKHPSFIFEHSWGLGVLFPVGDKLFNSLLRSNFKEKTETYRYKAEYLLKKIQVRDLTEMVEVRDSDILFFKSRIDFLAENNSTMSRKLSEIHSNRFIRGLLKLININPIPDKNSCDE